jgi:hypothetical protein
LEDPDFLAGDLSTEFIAAHPDLMPRARQWQEQQELAMAQFGGDRRRMAAMAAALAVAAG